MNKRIADRAPSVIVFPVDTLPRDIGGSDPAHGLFRGYLESGGKIVWVGWPPLLLNLVAEHDALSDVTIRRQQASDLLGISLNGALNSDMSTNRVTTAGRDWGLPDWWLGGWDLPVSKQVKALSLDERGFAGAWVKTYGGPRGTGFVYIGVGQWSGDVLESLPIIAEYRPR
jgi:hypothetical protein